MASHQWARTVEVARRADPSLGTEKPGDHPKILGYCITCQRAFRVGLLMLERIGAMITSEVMLEHNLSLKVRHLRWPATNSCCIWEHTYSVYTHNEQQHMVNAGIQIMIPKEPHVEPCKWIAIEVDMPIRKDASTSIQLTAERAINNIS